MKNIAPHLFVAALGLITTSAVVSGVIARGTLADEAGGSSSIQVLEVAGLVAGGMLILVVLADAARLARRSPAH